MSRQHARIVRSGDSFALEDLGSTNGSRVRGVPVGASVTLRDGDVLEVGRTLFRFRSELPTPPGSLADLDPNLHSCEVKPGLVTLLPALADKHAALQRIAASRVPVLLTGESGTGKEVLARTIHEASGRTGHFVAVNCGAIPQSLVEAQLFGHKRGAFSGATSDEPGFVRSAHQGTLFLDEIGDLPKPAQAVLLRVLQEGEVVPVGCARPEKVDVRILCATHQDLHEAVARRTFRADLFARLAGFQHVLPPLHERAEDLGLLVAAILSRLAPDHVRERTLSREAALRLVEYSWPLNVRELELSLSAAVVLAGDGPIEVEHLATRDVGPNLQKRRHIDDALRERLVAELRSSRGNVAEVARTMGKARMQVHRWLKRFHLDPKTFRMS